MLPAVKENTMVWTIIALLFLTLQAWSKYMVLVEMHI